MEIEAGVKDCNNLDLAGLKNGRVSIKIVKIL